MANIYASSSPGLATPFPQMRRAVTAPLNLAIHQGRQVIENEPEPAHDKILFRARGVKLVSFGQTFKNSPVHTRSTAGTTSNEGADGTLPWDSNMEHLVAIGIHNFL